MTVTMNQENDGPTITTLTGPVADQAALPGLLNRVRDIARGHSREPQRGGGLSGPATGRSTTGTTLSCRRCDTLSQGISTLRYVIQNLPSKQYLARLRIDVQRTDLPHRSHIWQAQPHRHTPQ